MAIQDNALEAVGLSREDLQLFSNLEPIFPPSPLAATADLFMVDSQAASRFFLAGQALVDRLPSRAGRSEREQAAVDALTKRLREVRIRFLRSYAPLLYAQLTNDRRAFVRIEDLVYQAAELVPGLVPTRAAVLADRERLQKDKEGYEVDQGLFLSQVLSHPLSGAHLVHAMLRPLPESLEHLAEFQKRGRLDLGSTTIERQGSVGYLYHGNPRFLNAEDDATTSTLELGVDVILLDPSIEVGVIRGKVVDHPKYAGRRIFNAGINLTHLYYGQISFLDFFIIRDMGFLHKMYRGLSGPEFWPEEVENTDEKPWIAAVETFAIGGGCQLLLAMDHVLAERSSFFSLPARKEGIIPVFRICGYGASSAIARRARRSCSNASSLPTAQPGQLICDSVVPDGEMDAALDRTMLRSHPQA